MSEQEHVEYVAKHFSLTHIVYGAHDPLGVPLALLSLSPIFLFVAYFALVVFTRRLTLLLLAGGSVINEAFSLGLKRILREPRPFPGRPHVGDGYGMPSSHSQAAAFLLAWGVGYALSLGARYPATNTGVSGAVKMVRKVRTGVYLFALLAWSLCVAYSRYALHYHSLSQILAGYAVGLAFGVAWYIATEYLPRVYPASIPGRIRATIEYVWVGLGGIGGWQLGGAEGGWGEGAFVTGGNDGRKTQ